VAVVAELGSFAAVAFVGNAIEPRSGVQIAIVAPTNQAVWTVMAGFLREMGGVEGRGATQA